MKESRGRTLTPYSMKVERMQRRIRPPLSMQGEHNQATHSRMSYWRRISQIRMWGAR